MQYQPNGRGRWNVSKMIYKISRLSGRPTVYIIKIKVKVMISQYPDLQSLFTTIRTLWATSGTSLDTRSLAASACRRSGASLCKFSSSLGKRARGA